jgi:outer membrane protein OmpA-like peptidoglycan-associated protein
MTKTPVRHRPAITPVTYGRHLMSRTRIAVVLPAIVLLATGCATKDWVNKIIAKERVDVEERVDSQGRRITGSVDSLGAKVKSVEEAHDATRTLATTARERADGAAAQADAAGSKADGAVAKATDVDGRLTRLWASRHKRSVVDSTKVHFGFNKFELDDGAQTALLTTIEEMKKNPALAIVLEGYTDPRGPRDYNLDLARRRVESVRRYLVASGVELWRINAIGLGPIDGNQIADKEKRRVTVTLTAAE